MLPRSIMSARIPKVPIYVLLICYFLSIIKLFISSLLQVLGFAKSADDSEDIIPRQTEFDDSVVASSADLIRRALPAVKFEDLILTRKVNASDQDSSCAICLCEYEGPDEIIPLMNCRHIFHESCLDRWMVNYQTTCPLCRTCLVPIHIESN
ncbi:hypothetical protein MKX01_018783 [Papaver californicum]|nr:hypothetical protein MKX01_018783 [Papaver californicum]